ncbi:MAG: methyltransferase family protein [Promethearchaeota archaeon]|jgi:protein-S-isoprenylcysteine O-methyltransferase Ste14
MDKSNNQRLRIFAVIWSGILVIIVLPIIGISVSLFLDYILGLPRILQPPINTYIGIPILIFGFFWAIWANLDIFRRGKGSPVPLKDTQTIVLVVKGPYKYCRNPMIFGYIFIGIGLGFFCNSYFLLIGFSIIITSLLIVLVKFWEENNLEERFGDSYREYKKKVSLLIPLPPKK